MEGDQFVKFLLSRRSIRKYKKPVPLELLLKMIEVARYAPSARNLQPWDFIIVLDNNVKNQLASIYPWKQPISEAPVGIVVACDEKIAPASYMIDCANAIIYLMLAAHAYGLGTCWNGLMKEQERKRVQEILKLPLEKIPIAIISVGWPDEKPEAKSRKHVKEITHLNNYGCLIQM